MLRRCYALLAVLLIAPTPALAQVLYVDADATGAATGTSWADAFTDLQSALATAEAGDELWVAEGIYTPTDGIERDTTFQLRNGVALYGGFDGSETSLPERDWTANVTILSGDIGAPGDATDNVYQVVTGNDTDATAVLDGFTITAAYADGPSQLNRGGGMRNDGGSPTVRHCIFRENEARNVGQFVGIGAGMFNINGSSPLLEDVRFEHNISQGLGAGLGNRVGSNPMLRDVVFLQNEAGLTGGGMTNESGSAPVLVDVQFIRNTAGAWTGGMDNFRASPSLYNVAFYGNVCANYGCGMTNDTNANALLVNVLFVGNRKLDGGEAGAAGLQNNGSSPTLIGVTFAGNDAPDGLAGGLGHRGNGSVTLRDVVFWGNGNELVDEVGGALDVSHALVEGGFAGGTAVLDADPLFVRPPSPGADQAWGTPDDDYGDLRLRTDSPALDAGDAAHLPADLADLDEDGDTDEAIPVDLDGQARIIGGALDLGSYEGGVIVSNESGSTVPRLQFDVPYPNPAKDTVSFRFSLDAPGPVRFQILDVLGRRVAVLLDEPRAAGEHTLLWSLDGLAPGSYLAVLRADGQQQARPFALLHP